MKKQLSLLCNVCLHLGFPHTNQWSLPLKFLQGFKTTFFFFNFLFFRNYMHKSFRPLVNMAKPFKVNHACLNKAIEQHYLIEYPIYTCRLQITSTGDFFLPANAYNGPVLNILLLYTCMHHRSKVYSYPIEHLSV